MSNFQNFDTWYTVRYKSLKYKHDDKDNADLVYELMSLQSKDCAGLKRFCTCQNASYDLELLVRRVPLELLL